jgi:integrase
MRTQSVGTDKRLAERLRREREQELNDGTLGTVRPIAFKDFMAEELEIMKDRLSPSSISSLRLALEDFDRVSHPQMLGDVAHSMVENYFADRLKRNATATANCSLRTLKASFSRAVGRGYLEANPAARVRQVKEPQRTIRLLTTDEIGKLFSACHSQSWRAFVALGATTGARLGELVALRWHDVDAEHGFVQIVNTDEHLTKSRRNRVMALFPSVCELLKGLPHRGEHVFTTPNGDPWRYNVQRNFARIVKRAGIPRCSMHDLRRSFCTHLAMDGIGAPLLQALAGHSNIATTMTYYVGVMPEALRAAQKRLPFHEVLESSARNRNTGSSEDGESEAAQVATPTCAAR